MKIIISLAMTLLALVYGCSSDDSTNAKGPITNEGEAQARAVEYVSGNARGAEPTSSGAEARWEVQVAVSGGAILKVELAAETGELREIKDDTGPFGYDFQPVPGILSFKEAEAKALAAQPGTTAGWKLEFEDTGEWLHEVYVRDSTGQLFEVKMAGDTGEVEAIEKKDAFD